MKSIIFGKLLFSDSHTGANRADWVKELAVMRKWCRLSMDSNIGRTAKTLETENGWYSLGCAGHTLQLCVNAGIKISSSVDTLLQDDA